MKFRSILFAPLLLVLLPLFARGASGPDVVVGSSDNFASPFGTDLAMGENGMMFAAAQVNDPTHGGRVHIYLSRDHGVTWADWKVFQDQDGNDTTGYFEPSLLYVRVPGPRILIAMRHIYYSHASRNNTIEVGYADAHPAIQPVFSMHTAMSQAGTIFYKPNLAANPVITHYVCVVAQASGVNGSEIWFARSNDVGGTWDPEYSIATSTINFVSYQSPRAAVDGNGYAHVVWERDFFFGAPAAYYRRALGPSTISDWTHPTVLLADSAGTPDVGALSGVNSGLVRMVVKSVRAGYSSLEFLFINDGANLSESGASTLERGAPGTVASPITIEWVDGWKTFHGAAEVNRWGYDSTFLFNELQSTQLADLPYPYDSADRTPVDLDPDFAYKAGALWLDTHTPGTDTLWFDGQWMQLQGFARHTVKRALPARPVTPPTLANLNADQALEILYADSTGNVYALTGDGNTLSGWPQNVGSIPANGSVCAGDLDGDGVNDIVAGNTAGQVFAWHSNGALLPGFPKTVNAGHSVYCSLGDMVGDSKLEIVACAGNQVHLLGGAAVEQPGFPAFTNTFSELNSPAAIGDVDHDGTRDIVVCCVDNVRWLHNDGTLGAIRTLTGQSFREAPTLLNVDVTPSLEIAVGTEQGKVYLLDAAGLAIRAGWPYTSGQPLPIHGISVGPLLCGGFSTPYLTFFTGTVLHKLRRDGTEPPCNPASYQSSYPMDQAPIIAAMDSMSAVKGQAVVFGNADSTVVGLAGNSDSTLNGFPCWVGDPVDDSPAIGDVNLNNRQDLVVLSRTSLHIYDVNTPDTNPSKDGSWPQYGYDPAHSFCYLCGGAPTVGVGRGPQAYRLGIAPVRPNPSRGSVSLDFALPAPGAARLAVFDISGRLVREIASQVLAAGRHSAHWDGRDSAGRETPAGVYVVRLNLEGGGSASEKLMRLR